jgi:U3 small nucleolar RNA-associated protein 21
VAALTSRLKQKKDYELVQAWMAVFLRLHMDEVVRDERLLELLREWRECQEREGRRLGELVGYCGGVVGFLRNPR